MVKPGEENVYVWCPKSAYFKRQLRKYGTREDVVKAAKAAYLFHLSEAKHLKKYLGQAFDTAHRRIMEDSSDSDFEYVWQPKRQKTEDQPMNKD